MHCRRPRPSRSGERPVAAAYAMSMIELMNWSKPRGVLGLFEAPHKLLDIIVHRVGKTQIHAGTFFLVGLDGLLDVRKRIFLVRWRCRSHVFVDRSFRRRNAAGVAFRDKRAQNRHAFVKGFHAASMIPNRVDS